MRSRVTDINNSEKGRGSHLSDQPLETLSLLGEGEGRARDVSAAQGSSWFSGSLESDTAWKLDFPQKRQTILAQLGGGGETFLGDFCLLGHAHGVPTAQPQRMDLTCKGTLWDLALQ